MFDSKTKKALLLIPFCIVVLIAFSKKPALGAVVFGSGILLFITYSLYILQQIRKNGIETIGRIVDVERSGKGNVSPVVEFDISSEEKITDTPLISSSFDISGIQMNNIGLREIRVIYHSKKPSQFILPDFAGQNTFSIVAIIAAALFFIIFGLYDYLS